MQSIIRNSTGGVMIGLFLLGGAAHAQSVTGSISVQIELTDACEVNGNEGTGVDFGTLDFGSHSALFTNATATLVSEISILCSVNVTPTLSMTGGTNDGQVAGRNHAMDDGSTNFVGYTVFQDATLTTQFSTSVPVTLSQFTDATPQTVQLWGEALGDPGNLVAGTYTDTLSVQLAW